MALRCTRLAIHNTGKIPLVTRPRHRSAHLDVRIRAVHPHLFHACSLLLVDSEIVGPAKDGDRKSTRLNSSHDQISYAVFCLKKKKKNKNKKNIKKKKKKKKQKQKKKKKK